MIEEATASKNNLCKYQRLSKKTQAKSPYLKSPYKLPGTVFNKIFYWNAWTRGSTPYLFVSHFDRKGTPIV